jgi:hypothetical protein
MPSKIASSYHTYILVVLLAILSKKIASNTTTTYPSKTPITRCIFFFIDTGNRGKEERSMGGVGTLL